MQNHTADSIKSLEGFDIAWVEEAQSLSQRSLDLLRPTIRKPGSEMWFSWNPNKPSDPVDVLLRGESPPADAVVVEVNWSDNPRLPAELRADLEDDRRRDPDKFAHIWGGHYSLNSEARVFRNWKVEAFERRPMLFTASGLTGVSQLTLPFSFAATSTGASYMWIEKRLQGRLRDRSNA
jgi:phage terminase large subunit